VDFDSAIPRFESWRPSASILAGRICDDRGNRMSPTHSNKLGVRYRYYVSHALLQNRKEEAGTVTCVPAPEIEQLVLQKDPIANLHGRNPRAKGQDTANTLFADQSWKRRRPVECSLDEEQVVVIDGRKFHADQGLTRVRLRRLRDINQFEDVGWIPKRRDLNCTHSFIFFFRWFA
jgi:hypothetical protein